MNFQKVISIKHAHACCALLTLFALALPAQAAIIEEVVVTAQKREQNVQDVGIAISALTGEQM